MAASTSVIAAQLYTLRDVLKTPAEIAKGLKKVKQIGYDAVQLSGMGKIDPKELAGILRGEGLTCCATHIGVDRMRNETAAVIEEHQMWGCKYTATGGFFRESFTTQDWLDFVKSYNEVAKRFEGSGITIGYHNHSHELARVDGAGAGVKTALDLLIKELDRSVWMEIDTYWITHGGGDPIAWINKVAGRMPCVHLKDMSITWKREQRMAEVGEGNLNWSGILAACKRAGVQWYIVEQDNCNGRDPFDSLGMSLRNLRGMGLT
jgi:sugar phosphate isomerase/epimerase